MTTQAPASAHPDWNSLSSMWPPEDKMDDIPSSQAWTSASEWASTRPTLASSTPSNSHLKPHPRYPRPSPRAAAAPAPSPPPPSMRAASVDIGYSSTDDPAAEPANRVRKDGGVVLAVQIGSDPQYQPPASTAPPAPSYPTPNTAASAFTTAPVAPSAPPTPATPVQTATQSRPKTSHTTIERRYRTNVNARIQLLHQAVPALRVVDRAAAIKAGELYRGGDASDPENHINARGFVDGVKIMCKCSKAVEYIRVLKNREKRLTRELEGLKTLLRGLVGGTELLGEWEREWVGTFGGGGERDEVGVEDGGNAGEDDDGEDEEGGGQGRKRKKVKVEHGTPRKVAPLPASDCMHKPAVRVALTVCNVYVVSVGQHGIGGKGKEAPSPSLSFPAVVPHVVVPFGSPAIASPLRTRAVESSTPQGMHIPFCLRAEMCTHCADSFMRPLYCIPCPPFFPLSLPHPFLSESVPAACPLLKRARLEYKRSEALLGVGNLKGWKFEALRA
ncbi:hypothetical protein B0H16DRAFT_1822947 [Mycena metata]|uniref:BHLH domain-containing protein n=1 Tax=Mycena metata TaxID=1033252 RepID=A0AAD7GZD0_9AGAR|nr:hypothetical protein B0H16DRAFT_1822947 [Mycena metata]